MGTGEYMDTAKRQDIRDIEQYGHCKSRISSCKFHGRYLKDLLQRYLKSTFFLTLGYAVCPLKVGFFNGAEGSQHRR
ncbi:hypothetical protein ISG34_06575 [Methanothermobacter marburgensis]|uniref:Uncharacterized protein n=2 Tax=Methanobacteriaceae TaxID=2159 RepID=D9PXH2_METTM|nr:conserved hypothetical protein [Methanothermobacter marburgensis str. Marburg]WBF08949.1 hypothetical protein ISG36_04535 [Methanothermobacter thermautotrophicus]WBF09461.1 hypothetical protein ISG34_06575 [Methanothermobacter marburgensis]